MDLQVRFDRVSAVESGVVIEQEKNGFNGVTIPYTKIFMVDSGDKDTISVTAKRTLARHTLCDLLLERGIPVTLA